MGRLWPLALVALLGAAGPESAEGTDPSLPGPRPVMPRSSSAKPSPGSWSATLTFRAAAVQPAAWHLSWAALHGEGMATDPLAAKRTARVGQTEPAESPSPSGNDGQQPHPSATTATTFRLLSVVPPWLSPSTAPVGTAAHGSSPATPSSSQGLGTRVPAATPPTLGPRSPTRPAPTSRMQGEGAGTWPPTAQGTSLAAVGQLVTGAAQPGSAGSTDSAKTPGAELAPSWGAATRPVRPQELPWQPGGREGDGELGRKAGLPATPARPTKPWSAVGLSLPGSVLPQSPASLRPGAGPGLTKVEGTTPGNFVGPATPHQMPLGQRAMEWEWQGPPLLSSAGVPSRSEGTLRSPPAATAAPRPGSPPYGTGHAPNASHWEPGPRLPGAPAGLPTDTTGGTGAPGPSQAARTALQTPTAPLPIPGPDPTRLPGPPKSIVTPRFSGTLPGPAQSSPPVTRHPPQWVAKGGTSSNAASRSHGTFVGHTDTVAQPADSRQGPQTAMPGEGFLLKAASCRTGRPAGGAPETAGAPGSWILGRGAPSTRGGPGTTEPWTSSASAWFATRGDSSRGGLPSRTGLFSSSAPGAAVPTAQGGETVALHLPPTTHHERPPPARIWRWRGGSQPGGPTAAPSVHGPRPLQTAAPSAGSPWPPVAARDPGRVARSDPPLASTWLLAVVPEATTPLVPATPREVHSRIQHVFVAENQPPRLKAAVLHLSWELSLAMGFPSSFGDLQSPESRALVLSIDATVTPLFASVPGFQRLEVRSIRPGGVEVLLDALFLAEAPGLWAALNHSSGLSKQLPPGLWVANSTVLWSMALERPLNLCVELFSCPAGYECVLGEGGNATCTSVCHRQYCKNQGICTHTANQTPSCRCPVGSDFWFLGVHCDYRVTHQALLGAACGLLVSLVLIGAAVSALVVRRVRMLLLEARADQTKSSYRRFCRLDDVSAHYWSEPWLASVDSLDNPAFSTSEELLHLQVLQPLPRGGCPDACLATTEGHCKPLQGPVARRTAGRPRSLCSWEQSSSSGNEHMIDSGKASEVSASSWPTEPAQWSPSPARHELSCKPTHKGPCSHSYCKGMELINLERSWTA